LILVIETSFFYNLDDFVLMQIIFNRITEEYLVYNM